MLKAEYYQEDGVTYMDYFNNIKKEHLTLDDMDKARNAIENFIQDNFIDEIEEIDYHIAVKMGYAQDKTSPIRAEANVQIDNAVVIAGLQVVDEKGQLLVKYPQKETGIGKLDIVDFVKDEDGYLTKAAQTLKNLIIHC